MRNRWSPLYLKGEQDGHAGVGVEGRVCRDGLILGLILACWRLGRHTWRRLSGTNSSFPFSSLGLEDGGCVGLGFYGLRFMAYSRLFGNWLSLAIMRLLCDMTYLWALRPTPYIQKH